MGTEYQLSYLKGAAVVLDAAPAASSLRNGHHFEGELEGGGEEGQLVSAIPRPKKRLIGRGPVDFVGLEKPEAQGGPETPFSSSLLNESIVEYDYSVSKKPVTVQEKEKEKRSILMIGSLRVDISLFECILRVRSGCYLLPQAGARAIVVVLEIPPKRPRMVDGLGEEDEQYVLIESTDEDMVHPAIEGFEDCLKDLVNLVDVDAVVKNNEGDVHGTSLLECDQNHLVKFANSIFAECDQLLVNTSTKQGVAPVVASSIKVTGNILCKTLLTTSTVAGSSMKLFGKALREVIPQNESDIKVSESTQKKIETAEWIGEKAVSASDYVVSTTSKAVQYTGKVVSDKILQSNFSKYWTGLDGTGAEKNGFFQTMGTVLDAMITSAVDLQFTIQKSAWSLLNDFKDTTIDIVDHKYGSDAAQATGKSVSAALNVGSATVSAATVARSASGLAKGATLGVAKESGDQIVSMEGWMGGSIQMYGVFELNGTTGWSQVWGVLRPDALAMYSQSDLVQERPGWIVTVRNISEVTREDFVQEESEKTASETCESEEGEEGEEGKEEEEEKEEKEEKVSNSKQCKIHLSHRSHGSWSFRFESQTSGERWCEALLRCIRSNGRCKLLGVKVDGREVI